MWCVFELVVKGGRVVTGNDDHVADVAVQDERIAAVGEDLHGERELDASGLYVIPGGIDGHVHMRTDRLEWVYDDTFETGSAAAAFGGVTTILDQAQVEPGTTLADGLDRRLAEAEGNCHVDYGLHVNLREADLERVAEIPELAARGFPSFKFFMVYEGFRVPDEIIFAAMLEVAAVDGLVLVHAENDTIIRELLRRNALAGRTDAHANAAARPGLMEGEAVHRTLAMAELAGARTLILHLTAAEAVRELAAARVRGQEAYGEVCVQYLVLGEEALDEPVSGTAFDFSPPLRSAEHRDALWQGLADASVDVVSTDHGPRRLARDASGNLYTPLGTSSIEVRLALLYTLGVRSGRLSLHRWVDACCTRPADVFGLPTKGRIRPGLDADLVLFDPDRRLTLSPETLHSNIDHSTYQGVEVHGFPVTTISRGEVIVEDGELLSRPGRGRLAERAESPGRRPSLPSGFEKAER